MEIPLPIQTERLQLRLLEKEDIEALFMVNGDEEVTRFLPYQTWRTATDGKAWYERVNELMDEGSALQLVIVERLHDSVIGSCLLFHFNNERDIAEIGYVMGQAYWRRGYAEEALRGVLSCVFTELKLRRLEAVVDTANTPSSALLEKLGFTREGMKKNDEGDTYTYGLLQHEWWTKESIS